jgi:RNA polymerase sigma-70 factor (ECF subfamily)
MNTFSAKALRQALARPHGSQDAEEERRLLAAVRRGDRRALDLVTRRVAGSLYRFSRGFCRNPDDADDVAQDVLSALVSSLPRFRGDSSLSSWAYVVARNACARRRRREARQIPFEDGDVVAQTLRDPGAGPERQAERRELREALERAIAALPASLRDVLVLRDVEGLPASQVARRLGLGERAVKSRLHRARVALRDELEPHVGAEVAPRRAARASSGSPDCPDVPRLLSRFLEGELDARACSRLEAHVSACAGCSAACDSLRTALGACAAWRRAPVPARLQTAVRAALRRVVTERAGRR